MNSRKSLLMGFAKISFTILFILAFTISAVSCLEYPEYTSLAPSGISRDLSIESDFLSSTSSEFSTNPSTEPSGEPSKAEQTQPQKSSFEVHFIDVGQADSALVLCDGKAMLIDGGNTGDSNLLYTYLKKHNIKHLDYVIGTHAHEDHIGGIAGALNYASVGKAYSPVKNFDTKAFENFNKAVEKHGKSLEIPKLNSTFSLGSAKCKILAVNTTADVNNSSIVLRITYGATSFVFTGDAEREVEQAIIDRNESLDSTVLKVGHHGSETSTSYIWLREVMPEYAVISVGKDNTYGHPHDEALSRLQDAGIKTFRTDLQGDIICTSDGKKVSFKVTKNENIDVFNPQKNESQVNSESSKTTYILNTNTKKFHHADCENAKTISNGNKKEYKGTRAELINQGYEPCGSCEP